MTIKNIVIGYVKPDNIGDDTLFLNSSAFSPLNNSLTTYNIQRESLDSVTLLFLAEKHLLIRHIFKQLDRLLAINGMFKFHVCDSIGHGNGLRSIYQVKHEFSLSTLGRYNLISESGSRIIKLVYEKKRSIDIPGDSIDKWSFGIITDGKKNEQVNNLVNSIKEQRIPEFEILICGPYSSSDKEIVVIDYEKNDCRGHITHKKNKIAQIAKYENLIILHDRYTFSKTWFERMKSFGNDFELLAVPNIGPLGGRVNDWPSFEGLPSDRLISNSKLLPYSSYSNSIYMQGGLIIIKRSIYNDIKLDEKLYWGELEDILFSKIAYLKGYLLVIDANNKIFTNSGRIKESRHLTELQNILRNMSSRIKRLIFIIRNVLLHFILIRIKSKNN